MLVVCIALDELIFRGGSCLLLYSLGEQLHSNPSRILSNIIILTFQLMRQLFREAITPFSLLSHPHHKKINMKLHETTYEIAYVRVAISLYLWLRSRPMEHSRSYKWHVRVSAKPNVHYNPVFFIYLNLVFTIIWSSSLVESGNNQGQP